MRRRVQKRKRQRTASAIAKDGEPPEPISLATATLIAAGLGTATAIGVPFINKALAPKPPKIGEAKSPLTAGEDTTLKPGQKVNAISTGPQGILTPPNTGRATLLGG